MLPTGIPEDHGLHTLGWGCLDWATLNLAQPDGRSKGDTWSYTADQARFILWYYAIDDTGRWVYSQAYRERAKGVGKTPMVAGIACTELCGPVLFGGWDDFGNPVGIPHPNPLVQLAAVSESQANQTMVLILGMLAHGEAEARYNLDMAESRIISRNRNAGRLEKVTASPRSREGARPTFVAMEETHNWVPAEHGEDFAAVLRRNLAKGDYRSIEVTNAPKPGEGSVAEMTHIEYNNLKARGEAKGVLFDTEWLRVEDIEDPEQAIPALKWIYRNSPWVNVDRIFEEICKSSTREADNRKFYFNEMVTGESGWLKKAAWHDCSDPEKVGTIKPLKKTDKVAFGFKSGVRNGAGAVVACRLTDMSLWLLGFWEKPKDSAFTWEVPSGKVDTKMRKLIEKYDTTWVCAEPTGWQDIIGRWSADYDDIKFEERWSSSRANWCKAVEQFEAAVNDQRIRFDATAENNDDLSRHVLNCHIQETPQGNLIRKETETSDNYIQAAQAAVLAVEAATRAIEDGALKEGPTGVLYSM